MIIVYSIIWGLLVLIVLFALFALYGRFIAQPVELEDVIKGTEKWTVTLNKYGQDDSLMDVFYLYTLNFIYGDKEQKKAYEYTDAPYTKQFVGCDYRCKVQINGAGIANAHGIIRYVQDWGLVYFNNVTEGSGFRPACINAPYGKPGSESCRFMRITDGLKLYISHYVLTFHLSYIGDSSPADPDTQKITDDDYNRVQDNPEEYSTLVVLGDSMAKLLRRFASFCYKSALAFGGFLTGLRTKAVEIASKIIRK